MQPHTLLMDLRMEGYRVWLKPPVIDEGGKKKSDLKLIVEGDHPLDSELRPQIQVNAPWLKLLVFLGEPPQWFVKQLGLVEDSSSPVTLRELAAATAYHVGGLERWREVLPAVVTALADLCPVMS